MAAGSVHRIVGLLKQGTGDARLSVAARPSLTTAPTIFEMRALSGAEISTYEQAYDLAGDENYPALHVQGQIGLQYVTAPGFVKMSGTDPGNRQLGNYVQFEDVIPAADGSIVLTVTLETLTPGLNYDPPINAIQLVRQIPQITRPPIPIERATAGIRIIW